MSEPEHDVQLKELTNQRSPGWAVVRSRIVLDIVAEALSQNAMAEKQVCISLRPQGSEDWSVVLIGSDTPGAMDSVVSGKISLAIINPSCVLTVATKGIPPFRGPQPLAAIAVIPSRDQLVLAIHERFGINSLEEIREKQPPLRVALRGQLDHSVHSVVDHVLAAAGVSLGDIISWGGSVSYVDGLPSWGERINMVHAGLVDAVFDEGAKQWIADAIDAEMTIVSIPEASLVRLEDWGYRRETLTKALYPCLGDKEVPTIDFSGFPIYVHSDAPDEFVTWVCKGLHAKQDSILMESSQGQWRQGMATADLVGTTAAAPLDVPFHRAADKYWRSVGYIS